MIELAALGLDSRLASHSNSYPSEGKHQIGTYPTSNDLT
jgi:hypothetical protein